MFNKILMAFVVLILLLMMAQAYALYYLLHYIGFF